ncbi:hypothetical protein ABLE93_20820 [Xanthobacter sp. KR7-65]|uniref:hypothetical protein n=1 Tax=Xanthobacter sp. KR7-65 TaxID=3156612 RepID=UPI0032B5A3A5
MDVAGVVAPDACLLSELLAARRARLAAGRAFRLENVGPALGAFLELVQADDLFDLAPRADGGLSRRAAA